MHKLYTILLLAIAATLPSCTRLLESPTGPALTLQQLQQLLKGSGYPAHDHVFQQGLVFMDDDIQNVYQPGRLPELPAEVEAVKTMYSWEPRFFETVSINVFAPVKDKFNAWARYYEHIAVVNTVLQEADFVKGALAEREQLKAEAYALRAWYYFVLVNLYAMPWQVVNDATPGVPLVLDPDYTGVAIKRNTVKEVYGQVMADLDQALHLLEKQPLLPDPYRIDANVVHFMACRVSLYMGAWEQAINHANAVLEEQPALAQLAQWGTPDPENRPVSSAGNIETVWAFGSLDEYRPEGFAEHFAPSSDLLKIFSEGDLRKVVYLQQLSLPEQQQYGYTYRNIKRPLLGTRPQTGKNFRTAELYLNRAEARLELYAATGDADHAHLALGDLNHLRRHRISAAHYSDMQLDVPAVLLAECRKERRRELFGEDHRWFDLRRTGMPAIGHPLFTTGPRSGIIFILGNKDPQYTWAIPEEAIRLNPLLEQNMTIRERISIEMRGTRIK